jgi:outer membrane protein TolC
MKPHLTSMAIALAAAPAGWRHAAGTVALHQDSWQGAGDTTLPQPIHEALARNRDPRQASARVAEARAQATAQHAALWPGVDAEVGAERPRSIGEGGSGALP